jgi:putative endonuclease
MKQPKQPAVCILASGRNGTFYTGVTSALVLRIWQHREHVTDGFTKEHDVTMLVWYELHGAMGAAILREKQIKAWKRQWKIELIEKSNPYWRDLWPDILDR